MSSRFTESDFQDRLAGIGAAADEVARQREELAAAQEDLLARCNERIAAGVPILYVAKAARINRTKLYRLLGRLPKKENA